MNSPMKLIHSVLMLAMCLGFSLAVAQDGLTPVSSYSLSPLKTRVDSASITYSYAAPNAPLYESYTPSLLIGFQQPTVRDVYKNPGYQHSQTGMSVGLVMGMGSDFEWGAMLNTLPKQKEVCDGTLCVAVDDSGHSAELFGRWWLNYGRTINVGVQVDSNAQRIGRYSSTGLSVGYLLQQHHQLSFKGERLRDVYGTDNGTVSTFVYNYLF